MSLKALEFRGIQNLNFQIKLSDEATNQSLVGTFPFKLAVYLSFEYFHDSLLKNIGDPTILIMCLRGHSEITSLGEKKKGNLKLVQKW